MIEFEIGGDFRNTEDVCCVLEEVISQMRQGYTSGYFGDGSWSASGEEEEEDLDDGDDTRLFLMR